MRVYRLARKKYAKDLTGEGARLNDGRWNRVGTPCLYSSDSRALAILEYSVNIDLVSIPLSLCMVTLEIPENSLLECKLSSLPANWHESPSPADTKDFGTNLLAQLKYLVIKIPSVIIQEEFNYLINPLHPGISKVTIVDIKDFVYDARIKSK